MKVMVKKMKGKMQSIVTSGMFLGVLFGVSIWNLAVPVRSFSENENRVLQQLPEWSIQKLLDGSYTTDFEKFTTDQFPQRDFWVGMKTSADLAILKQDVNGVYFAKDDYLIEKYTENDLDRAQLEKNLSRLEEFTERCQQLLGKDRMKAMIVPTAAEILEEKLPAYAPTLDQRAILEEFAEGLPQDSFLDVTPVLDAAVLNAAQRQVYYRTDHHWTTYGAFLAYQQWADSMGWVPWTEDDFQIEQVTDSFYGTVYSKANYRNAVADTIELYFPKNPVAYHLTYNQGEWESDSLYNMEYLEKKDKYAMFLDGNNPLVQIQTNVANGRKLLVVKDSYAHSMLPFIVNHYQQVDVIDLRYFHQNVMDYIQENEITDVLVLYHLKNFAEDSYLGYLTN